MYVDINTLLALSITSVCQYYNQNNVEPDKKSITMLQILKNDLAETNTLIRNMEEAMDASNSKKSKALDDLRYKRDILMAEINKYELLFGGDINDN